MDFSNKVAVTSRSFSKSPQLRHRLQSMFGNACFNEDGIQLTNEKLIQFLTGAHFAIIGLEQIDKGLLDQLPDLQIICKMGTGIDKVDLVTLHDRKIAFSATPGINKRSVSELVLGLIFTLQRRLATISILLKSGVWSQLSGHLLSNKTIGILGYGAIGQDLAYLVQAFNCRCLIYDKETHLELLPHVFQVDLQTLLSQSDIVSLHLPLLPETYHFIGKEELMLMKSEAILINTARGGLVDEEALYESLRTGYLSGSAFDVFENEPQIPEKLLSLNNFFATSHIGGSTEEAIEAMGVKAIEYLEQMVIKLRKEKHGIN